MLIRPGRPDSGTRGTARTLEGYNKGRDEYRHDQTRRKKITKAITSYIQRKQTANNMYQYIHTECNHITHNQDPLFIIWNMTARATGTARNATSQDGR
ncbi:hypothetical protein CBFG_05508 [Clostridiales bacterium 1_7_47FAA]|nr:hypothetical protein CBFG_05508 [Clostridiales bacterium 1_7_47FAA]